MRRRNPSPSSDGAEFFCDRGLGKRVYEALEADGWTVHPMFKVWPRSENKRLDDDVWIPKVTEYGWIILAKDEFNKGNERKLLYDHGARAFSIFHAGLRSAEMIARFLNNKEAIHGHCATSGPFLHAVQTDRLRKVDLP